MTHELLQTIWFLLVFVLLGGYAILDGFDLGVGILHLGGTTDEERRIHLNAIAPVWDGNEVWLLTGGGALFAAFPMVYATSFSAFYLALMLVLITLIARAVSIEFRSKVESPTWQKVWDVVFFLGSVLPSILFGVAFGNVLRGLPLDVTGTFTGTFFGLLNPFSILIGVLTLVLFRLHGALYLAMKISNAHLNRILSTIPLTWITTVILYGCATAAAFKVSPFLFQGLAGNPLFWIFLALLLVGMMGIPVSFYAGKFGKAFICSSMMIAAMMGLAAVSLFPRLLPSSTNLDYSLTIQNSSSTKYTLTVMLVIALIGMPLVIAYTVLIYRAFKGKTVIPPEGY